MDSEQKGYFISAIGTDSGKTLASAIVAHKLKASYWKPIQCGFPTDTHQIQKWLGSEWPTLPERYLLQEPCSPHRAAEMENSNIRLGDFTLPALPQPIVVEGAGGLLVPINPSETMADLIQHLALPIILVVNHYLGGINHTLLTLAEIDRRQLPLVGIIFNGHDFQNSEALIVKRAGCPVLLSIQKEELINTSVIEHYSQLLTLNS